MFKASKSDEMTVLRNRAESVTQHLYSVAQHIHLILPLGGEFMNETGVMDILIPPPGLFT